MSSQSDHEDEDESNLNIYKSRHRADNEKVFINPQAVGRYSEENLQNIVVEIDEQKRHKIYAILQEPKSDLTTNRLRYFLLIYINSFWNLFVLSVIFISYILDTCVFTFYKGERKPSWIIFVLACLNLVFAVDVTFLCGLKFSKQWRKTLNLVEPSIERVIVDLFLAVPYPISYLLSFDLPFHFFIISPVMATVRVYRIIEFLYNKSSQAGTNQWTIFLAQYLILFLLSVHTWTCIWYLSSYRSFNIHSLRSSWSIGAVNLPTETVLDWHFICAYWSVMILTTNSLGDLYPVSSLERVVATVAVLLGFFLTTVIFVGSLTSQFITITTRRAKYVRQLKKIQNHLQLINMDADTTSRVLRFVSQMEFLSYCRMKTTRVL
ncbi:uncharacterized protein LOC126965798 [Leptidea sinapis]|uniref:uncharacterized protein LOC126965798 n=1 Tax=Leptidea sinapis TaxID=189913 RepID=UPI0021C3E825|nr:uncharacterized protein LOC126965798 [Leptidea sinapis]